MYGTIARFKVAPGKEGALLEHLKQYESLAVPGFVASALYRSDAEGGGHFLAVVFESSESYRANAESPAQDIRYQEFRALLETEPEWHDGEILQRVVAP